MEQSSDIRIDGRAIAKKIEERVKADAERLIKRGVIPRLVSVAVDDEDPSFESYMKSRAKACARVGIESEVEIVPLKDAERALGLKAARLSEDRSVHGVLFSLPLPSGVNDQSVYTRLDHRKDVEGMHPWNAGLLALGRPRFVPCTALAVMEILKRETIDVEGRHVVILGRSKVVGAPLASMLLHKSTGGNGTVTVCHSRTRDLPHFCAQADILVAAIGQPEFVKGEWLRQGAVVLDVGTHAIDDPAYKRGWRLVGDVHYESACTVASRITPVPGGVGPVTTALLLQATVRAAMGADE